MSHVRRTELLIIVLVVVASLVVAACGRLAGSPAASPVETITLKSSRAPTPAASASAAAATAVGDDPIAVDLEALRAALLGPSPVPSGWGAEVDEIIANVERALSEISLPDVAGLDAQQAACATWQPLVGRLDWATGAFVERQVMLAHLGQLSAVAPDEIRSAAAGAASTVATAAAEQLTPDGDPEVIGTAPKDDLREIGRWALEHCELEIVAEPDPDTEDWTDDDIAFSCDLDRRLLVDAMEEFRQAPGAGRYATHPHELEIAGLDVFVYPAWHMLAEVDNDATPPTFEVAPIPGGFCDR